MTWNVTYRAPDGQTATARYEAGSRDALFALLRERGVRALRVEAAPAGARASLPQALRARPRAWAAAVLAVLLVGALCGLLFWPHPAAPRRPSAPPVRRPAAVRTPPPPRRAAPAPTAAAEAPKPVVTNFVNDVWHDERGRPHYQVSQVIRPGRRCVINGKPWRPEKPVFHRPSEVELDVVLSRRPGERLFGDVNWQAFARDLPGALASPVEILPDDPPDVVARKEAVAAAKKELADALKAGENPSEILKAARDDVNRLADVRDNLLSTVAELKREGAGEQEIEDAVAAANKMLAAHGIDQPLVSPRTMRERAAAARLRKQQGQQNAKGARP